MLQSVGLQTVRHDRVTKQQRSSSMTHLSSAENEG